MAPANTAIKALLSFEMNGMLVFDPSAKDLVLTSLESAHALAIMLAAAFTDSDETSNTNPVIINRALEGIARLIALAAFAGDAA